MTREISAGGLVIQKHGGNVLWLVVKEKSSKDFPGDRYQFPKGKIEDGETSEQTAVREVFEETGIKAKIIDKIDTVKFVYQFRGEKIFKIVVYFLMEFVSGDIVPQSGEIEKVLWLPTDEAEKILTISSGKSLLGKAVEMQAKLQNK